MEKIWKSGGYVFCGIWLAMLAQIGQATTVFNHDRWDALLKSHVYELRNGQATEVDYDGFAADREGLRDYLKQLQEVDPASFNKWSKAERLAFLINAYNAWTVELILQNYPNLESIRDLGSWFQSPWKKAFIPLLGGVVSLDDIEHGMIRGDKSFDEPRIHFAVNCASIGCPALGRDAYTGPRLDQQLELATVRFLRDRTRNRLENDELQVSKIFQWYEQDFAMGWRGADSLEAFLALYAKALGLNEPQRQGLLQGELDVDHLDYDWGLNKRQ